MLNFTKKLNMKVFLILVSFLSFANLSTCNQNDKLIAKRKIERIKPKPISYTLEKTKNWLKENASNTSKLEIVTAINRTDSKNLSKMDSIIIPNNFSGDKVYFLPFPIEVDYLKDISKIVIFSYPTQSFAAYENGILVYSGPTNMGRKKDQTPIGLFFTNWKAEKTTSTFNDEWDLKWNFNIENKLGVGFHEYELPGYPASHSCLRLQEKDAKNLYDWADQWILEDEENVKVKGTPIIVFGNYNFDGPKPWLQLVKKPNVLNITNDEIKNQVKPYFNTIMKEQKIREIYLQSE